ncbi:MAG: hypothetical protein K0R58_2801, partial [Ramlibacter sp.]|nr:hypothetical protein [Ramlibacter sp.]
MAIKRLHATRRGHAGSPPDLDLGQYQALFAHMTEAFMLGDIVRDTQGRPVDFRVLVANDAFHRLTGVPPAALGRPLRETLPQLEDLWIEQYSHVALTGEPARFTSYNADTRRHYEVNSYQPEPGRFAALFRDVTAQVEMEQALREQQRLLSAREHELTQMITGLPGLVWTTTADGIADYHSEQWRAYTGIDPRALQGDGWLQTLHPDDRSRAAAAWKKAATTGGDYDINYRIRRHDGVYHWFNARGVPLRDEGGRILRWFGICIDIDDLKSTQEALADSEQRYSALFNNRFVAITHNSVITDDAGQPVDVLHCRVNDAYLRVMSTTREKIEGKRLTEVFPEAAHMEPNIIQLYGEVALKGGELQREIFFPATGQWFQVDVFSHRHRQFTVLFSDISARKLAEEALASSEAELRATFEQAGVGICYVNPEGCFVKVNPKVCAMLGYTREELATLHVRHIVHPDDAEAMREQFAGAIRGELASYIAERRYLHKDGHVVWVRITASPVRHPDSGDILYIAKFIEDITERKRARAELEGFFRQATVGLTVKDTESRLLRLNQRLCDMLGYRMEELQGTPYLALVHPDDLPAEKKLLERLVAGEIPEYSLEARLRSGDGSYVWAMTSATLIR